VRAGEWPQHWSTAPHPNPLPKGAREEMPSLRKTLSL
jgi:hypothetical protein